MRRVINRTLALALGRLNIGYIYIYIYIHIYIYRPPKDRRVSPMSPTQVPRTLALGLGRWQESIMELRRQRQAENIDHVA